MPSRPLLTMGSMSRPATRSAHAALLAVAAAGTTALVWVLYPQLRGPGLWLGVAAMLAASAVAAAVRPAIAAPVVALTSCYLVMGPWAEPTAAGATIWLAVAVSLLSAAAAQTVTGRREAVVAFAPFAAFALAVAVSSHTLFGALGALAPVLGGSTAGLWVRLRTAQRERRALAERQARADERLALAAQLHDLATARLTRIVLSARAAGQPGIEDDAQAALADLRRVVVGLQTADAPSARLATDGLVAPAEIGGAITEAVVRARDAGQQVDVAGTVSVPLPRATADCLARVLEEGLANARKHAVGAPVVVQVTDRGVRVHNPSTRADSRLVATGSGTGLRGLAARTALIGGTLRHGPSPDGGWVLQAEFPAVAR
ncbi:histidine kinase OS=Tsukamurella paurometabola (strain ATCC 8368 / DSM / CCUG 35730 / CIP 100753/ JCM 10117 / KCTC 9821 / NBRC 16120 / NCIMB 702349 / NCTC 13040) OX=521096 GN=Tpau_2493 PE=4 SV=1 [Tsukamurella paurometabola]|uniref:histidine kinase n=2 Tax=Tsukamurella paurometabola TaxID=2061 RepID=D5URP2_TSUPD|nr:histidine kinase [Tsukamurella paurometabola DSM 20162]SUP34067.1 Signal transduction histidine kinase [Tsukamurella paurometabola]